MIKCKIKRNFKGMPPEVPLQCRKPRLLAMHISETRCTHYVIYYHSASSIYVIITVGVKTAFVNEETHIIGVLRHHIYLEFMLSPGVILKKSVGRRLQTLSVAANEIFPPNAVQITSCSLCIEGICVVSIATGPLLGE